MIEYSELSPTEKIVFLERMLDTYKVSFSYFSEDANELLQTGKLYSKETYIVMNKLEQLKEEIDADFYRDQGE